MLGSLPSARARGRDAGGPGVGALSGWDRKWPGPAAGAGSDGAARTGRHMVSGKRELKMMLDGVAENHTAAMARAPTWTGTDDN